MIKANELRVGNLLEYYIPTDNLGWLVETIDWQDIRECQEQNESFNSNNRGIKLNEQWLIDLGFEFNDFDETYCKGRIRITKDLKVFVGLCLLPKKNYVHEIQNIFFDIEGVELTLKTN